MRTAHAFLFYGALDKLPRSTGINLRTSFADAAAGVTCNESEWMQLGENELIESIRSNAKGVEFKKEGRRAPRIDRTGKARIQIDGVGPILTVRVRNYSSRGIGLIHTSKLTVGQQFVLILPRNDRPPMRILCTIAHMQPLSGGEVFAIGAEFTLVLGEAKVGAPVPADETPMCKIRELERIRSSILS